MISKARVEKIYAFFDGPPGKFGVFSKVSVLTAIALSDLLPTSYPRDRRRLEMVSRPLSLVPTAILPLGWSKTHVFSVPKQHFPHRFLVLSRNFPHQKRRFLESSDHGDYPRFLVCYQSPSIRKVVAPNAHKGIRPIIAPWGDFSAAVSAAHPKYGKQFWNDSYWRLRCYFYCVSDLYYHNERFSEPCT